MSHAYAQIIHDGKIIGHSEYNGTVDVMAWNSWYDSQADVDENWRKHKWVETCKCEPVEITIFTSYGPYFWHAAACLQHRVILANLAPYSEVDWFKRDHQCDHRKPFQLICVHCEGIQELRPTDGHPLGFTEESLWSSK